MFWCYFNFQSLCNAIHACLTHVRHSGLSGTWEVVSLIVLFSKSLVWYLESDPQVYSLGIGTRVHIQCYGVSFPSSSFSLTSQIFSGSQGLPFLVLWPETVALVISLCHLLSVILPISGATQQKRNEKRKKRQWNFVLLSWDHSSPFWKGVFPSVRVLGTCGLSLLVLSLLPTAT